MDSLIERLVTGKHTVLFEPLTKELSEIKERLNQGFVFINFSDTQGGTELGINVDTQLSLLEEADFSVGKGNLKIIGACELNFQKIRCIAGIDLETRKGIGYLELLDE